MFAATVALALMTTAVAYFAKTSTNVGSDIKSLSAHHATGAYLRNQDIVVEMSDGCLGIVKGSDEKELGVARQEREAHDAADRPHAPVEGQFAGD